MHPLRGPPPQQGRLDGMCGRYANFRRDSDLIGAFRVEDVRDPELEPSWNVAPQQNVRIVLERLKKDEPEDRRTASCARPGGGWCPDGRRTPRSGASSSTPGPRASPRSRRSRPRPPSAVRRAGGRVLRVAEARRGRQEEAAVLPARRGRSTAGVRRPVRVVEGPRAAGRSPGQVAGPTRS